jgi:uncharacterized protein (UPF0276 family)
MLNLACGFNENFHTDTLKPHADVKLIEIGYEACQLLINSSLLPRYHGNFSLHLSRSAITEEKKNQKEFILKYIKALSASSRLTSIGFHLMNARTSNIGKYGFTSHYEPTLRNERRAIEFIASTQELTGLEVWIENANFYSRNVHSIIESWRSIVKISEKTNAKIIFDLSHLIIDCVNCEISPNVILGMIPWGRVAELHISGIITDKNGRLHDGHSKSINEETWGFLNQILLHNLVENGTYINIEHTDLAWSENFHAYESDFSRLNSIISAYKKIPERTGVHYDANIFAQSYVKKTLSENIENMDEICSALDVTKEKILDGWIRYIDDHGVNLCLMRSEVNKNINNKHLVTSFREYIEYLSRNESRC